MGQNQLIDIVNINQHGALVSKWQATFVFCNSYSIQI